jgi:phosphatidylinositol alpha-1,6-mannosyltransferase
MIYRKADVIIAANEFARQHLLAIGIPGQRVHKILPGVDMDRIYPAAPRRDLVGRYGLQGKVVLLTLARFVPRKGVHLVLRSLPLVLKKVPNLRYLIGGAGPQQDYLMQLVRDLGLQQVVEFIGNVPAEEVSDYYNLCDVFAMVNRTELEGDIESFGMVFVEANGAGKPVLGGRSGGTTESIEEGVTGLIADPESREDIAAKLIVLLQDGALRMKLGRAGLVRVQRDFRWRSRALQLDRILRDFSGVCNSQA